MSPYDPDSRFSRSALYKLEAAGIPVMASLAKVSGEFVRVVGLLTQTYTTDKVIDLWLNGESKTDLPPTWRSLYGVLRGLDLVELSEQIELYLSGRYSHVIMFIELCIYQYAFCLAVSYVLARPL